jgi:hypothetical protein
MRQKCNTCYTLIKSMKLFPLFFFFFFFFKKIFFFKIFSKVGLTSLLKLIYIFLKHAIFKYIFNHVYKNYMFYQFFLLKIYMQKLHILKISSYSI